MEETKKSPIIIDVSEHKKRVQALKDAYLNAASRDSCLPYITPLEDKQKSHRELNDAQNAYLEAADSLYEIEKWNQIEQERQDRQNLLEKTIEAMEKIGDRNSANEKAIGKFIKNGGVMPNVGEM